MDKNMRKHMLNMAMLIAFWLVFLPLIIFSQMVIIDGVPALWQIGGVGFGGYIKPFHLWEHVLSLRDYTLLLAPLIITCVAWAAGRLLFKKRPQFDNGGGFIS